MGRLFSLIIVIVVVSLFPVLVSCSSALPPSPMPVQEPPQVPSSTPYPETQPLVYEPEEVPEPSVIPNKSIEIRALALNPPRGVPWENALDEAERAGTNYVVISYWMFSDLSGEIARSDPSKEIVIDLIRQAHDRDLKVWLNIRTPLTELLPTEEGSLLFEFNLEMFNGLSDEARHNFLGNLEPIILEWARICEEESVELFTPVATGQLYLLLFDKVAFEWPNTMLPNVKERFSGLLIQKIDLNPGTQQLHRAGLTSEVCNFEGWDYVSTDIWGTNATTYEEWRTFLRDLLDFCLHINEKYETKGMVLGS